MACRVTSFYHKLGACQVISSSPKLGEARRGLSQGIFLRLFRPPLTPPNLGGEENRRENTKNPPNLGGEENRRENTKNPLGGEENRRQVSGKWNLHLPILFLSFIFYFLFSPARAQIGTWKNYLAYYNIQQIREAGSNDIFVLASNGLYQYNKTDQSIYTYDKTNGLSDTYITNICWCAQAKRLIAVYQNSNIDLIDLKGNVTNISDLYTKAITGDKTVSSIRIDGIYAYLICGFGIVKVNVQRAEIADSYRPTHPEYPTSLPAEDNSDYEKYIELVKTLKPGGPNHNTFGFMRFINGTLYTCGGSYYAPAPLQAWNGDSWQIYQDNMTNGSTTTAVQGPLCLDAYQTAQGEVLFLGARNGLFEYLNANIVNYYDYNNSPIERFDGKSNDYQMITGIKFDGNNSLWFLNSQAPTASLMCLNNGQFTKYNHSEIMKLNDGGVSNKSNASLSNMIFDSQGTMWFVNNSYITPAVYQYDKDNNKILAYESFVNQDGTTLNVQDGIHCITEDLNSNMWIGSNSGPFMLERTEINNDGKVFTQVKVPRNDGTNYADYLLSGIDIKCIAIDGGNRKWFGTNGYGVYLISADNMTQIHHFTTENSKLLSNTVMSIAINPKTGEVFFGTDKGLCSYISDATQTNTEMTTDNVWAYPNPVEPGYTGNITITGLSMNADVKILTANGAIVNEGHSNGGTYVWDGCDQKGRRVASGIYMVATATSTGQKGTVCKIAIVN